MSFANLKKSSMESFKKLAEAMQQEIRGKDYSDARFWNPSIDKSGNGYAVLRFLPSIENEQKPYVKVHNHGFQLGKRWFIENCPSTINLPCPICEHVSNLYNSGTKDGEEKGKARKRSTRYISNIYIVSDPKQPENENKVFLFKYVPTIFNKLMSAIKPEFEDETPFNPFNFWTGANFKFKVKNVAGFRNYDTCEFASCGPLNDDDNVLEAIWKKQYPLEEFIDPSQFKSYDQLKQEYASFLTSFEEARSQSIILDEEPEIEFDDTPKKASKPKIESDDDDSFETWAKLIDD